MNKTTLETASIAAAFLAAVAGPMLWFAPENLEDGLDLAVDTRTDVPGFRFESEPLDDVVLERLGTTDCVNGAFFGDDGEEFRVFSADWDQKKGAHREALSHTPDMCWAKVGWQPRQIGQSQRLDIALDDGAPLTFECRVFQAPMSDRLEMVVWTSLLNGRVMDEGERWDIEIENPGPFTARRRDLSILADAIKLRRSSYGVKQFVRLSKPVTGTPEESEAALVEFLKKTLTLRRSVPPGDL